MRPAAEPPGPEGPSATRTGVEVPADPARHHGAPGSLATIEDAMALAGVILWESDAVDWQNLFVSSTIRDLTGHDPEEWLRIREFWEDHLHPDDRAATLLTVGRGIDAGASGTYEYRWRIADGTYRWFRDRFRIVHGPDGRRRMAGVMVDITAEKEAAATSELVARERDWLVASMEQSTELIVATDPSGVIAYVNPAVERTLGYRREDAIGKTLFDLVGAEAAEYAELRATVDVALAGVIAGRPWSGEVSVPTVNGDLVRLMSEVYPVREPDGTVRTTIGFHRDITRLKDLEQQLVQAAKLEAIGQLAGGVAHDFNNLLTAILGYAALVADEVPPGSPARDDVHQIQVAGERAQRLTRQLLAFGRRSVLRPSVVDVGELLTELLPMLGRLIGEDIVLRFETPPAPAVSVVDPDQLEQAVINLVVNARNAMPAGGEITVRVGVRTEGDGASGSVDAPHEWVVVEVGDTGTGIEADVLERIFEPFFTTSEFGQGTGLGLAVVDGFVRQSGGRVTVASAPGAGTTFAMWLPVRTSAGDQGKALLPEEPVEPPGRLPLTVLVAEDEATLRDVIRRALMPAGHRVLLASSGQEALDIEARFDGPIDVLLSDVIMPGIRGPELAAELRRRRPGIRVVLASGYTEDEVLRRGVAVGEEVFLQKPFSLDRLVAVVEGRLVESIAGADDAAGY